MERNSLNTSSLPKTVHCTLANGAPYARLEDMKKEVKQNLSGKFKP